MFLICMEIGCDILGNNFNFGIICCMKNPRVQLYLINFGSCAYLTHGCTKQKSPCTSTAFSDTVHEAELV